MTARRRPSHLWKEVEVPCVVDAFATVVGRAPAEATDAKGAQARQVDEAAAGPHATAPGALITLEVVAILALLAGGGGGGGSGLVLCGLGGDLARRVLGGPQDGGNVHEALLALVVIGLGRVRRGAVGGAERGDLGVVLRLEVELLVDGWQLVRLLGGLEEGVTRIGGHARHYEVGGHGCCDGCAGRGRGEKE